MSFRISIPCLLLGLGLMSCGASPLVRRPERAKASVAASEELIAWDLLSPDQHESLGGPGDGVPEPVESAGAGLPVGNPDSPATLGLFLGIGEAPYDDGLHPNDLHFREIQGFSDSVVHVSYEAPIRSQMHWFSQVSATRYQSQSLMETLEEGRVAWVTLGLRFAW